MVWVADGGLDLVWLWCRPAARAPIRPLALEPPYAMCAALTWGGKKKEEEEWELYRVRVLSSNSQAIHGSYLTLNISFLR